MGHDSLYFRVLGDVCAVVDGEARLVTAARQRAALAILLLSANRTVSTTSLIDGIYGTALPQHPDTALQIVVSRLRDSLGPAAARLRSLPGGYRIDVATDELDLTVVQSGLARGVRLRRDGDGDRAVAVLDEALACCGAEPLQGLAAFPFFGEARERLRELRLTLVELRNDALLDCGRHVEVLDAVERGLREEPWRERLRVQQMLALYRSGRHVEALRAYETHRRRLVDELGVEPSRELSDLHYAVLTHAPELAVTANTLGSRVPLWTSLVLPFVGRDTEQECIFGHLRAAAAGRTTMVLVDGEAGIGKTRLVLELARRAQSDAIIVWVTGSDALCPPIVGLGRSLVDATAALPIEQLRLYLGRDPAALAAAVPALGERLPDLRSGDASEVDDEVLSAAVISCIRALSARGTVLLLFDDLHRGGAAMLELLERLLTSPGTDRVAVVATSRSPSSQRSAALADFAERLERQGRLQRLQLAGLDLPSVECLLARLGFDEPGASARALHEVTHGHPFFLSEILQSGDWRRALSQPPPNVREFVRRRIAALGAAVEGVLLDAAALRTAFDAGLLAEISGVPDRTSEALIDVAVGAGVLRAVEKGTFAFVHELSRRALLDRVDDPQRARLHERIARALERRDGPCSESAWHRRAVAATEIDLRGPFHDSPRPGGRVCF